MYDKYFVLTGAVCLGVALLQAWLLVARFASDTGPIARIIPGKADLLRSHIDYLMMAQFLFVFFALYKYFALAPPAWLVATTCLGSFFNPFAFFVRALRPQYLTHAPPPFMAMITLSCVATTVGYGATAWLLATAAFTPYVEVSALRRVFSTRDVHPRDRLAYWQDVACKAFVEIECCTNAGAAFDATIWSSKLAGIGVSLVETDQCDVYRQPEGIALETSDAILLSLQLSGEAVLAQNGREAHLTVNDFAVYDTTQTYALRVAAGVRQLVLKLPRHELERRLGPISRYSARPVRASEPLGSFASGFLGLIPTRTSTLDHLPEHAAGELSQQVLDIVALAFRNATDLRTVQTPSREISLARLKMAIEKHLADPAFGPATAAGVAGISVRYANELLAAEGSSLERYILDRRLERCAEALANPCQRGRRIGDIAFSWGFSDASHFSRLFRTRFGRTPRGFRQTESSRTPGELRPVRRKTV